MYTDYMATT
uniref:Uncharacterized protein n=1 Tax=Arundo donax TaxID=35708 RepID=A0A0A9BIE8_ARUDO